jgi:hypothetical protein
MNGEVALSGGSGCNINSQLSHIIALTSDTKAKHAPESLALQGLPQVAVAVWSQMWT